MSHIHVINLPLKIIIGSNVLDNINEIIESIGLNKITKIGMVTGRKTYEIAGARIEGELTDKNISVKTWIVESSTINTAEEIVSEAKNNEVKLMIGVGGGKAIDIAKYVAYKIDRDVVNIPTAASHDGIASPFASLTGLDKPMSILTKTPRAIIADIDIISKAPSRLLKAGVGDLLGKLVAVRDWRLAHRLRGEYYGEYAAKLALLSAKHVIKYSELIASNSIEGVRVVVEGLISSGVAMCIAGSSRPASGSEHLFSHALEILKPGRALHGEKVALGTIIMLYIYGSPLWRRVRRIMKKIGLPTTAREIGIEPDVIVEALTIAHKIRPDRYTVLGETGLSKEAAWRILRETGIID